jgi:tripartite-type tricarboxylate transporter receptor subunit TctC
MLQARREFLQACLVGLAAAAQSAPASGADYPARPVTIVVPFPAGGPGDTVARTLTEQLRESLNQPVIIENVSGAAGSIGTGKVARSNPDGYTLVLGYWGTHVVNAAIYSLQYDVMNDFEPIALLTSQPLIIVGKKNMPADDLKSLIAWLKANPAKASQGTAGLGSIGHVAGLLFQAATDTRFQFVPYRGTAPALQDLVAGQIDLGITTPVTAMPQVRAGHIKAYAITGESRLSVAPEVPTVSEAGLPGLHVSFWQALWAPKGTPSDVIARLNRAVRDALAHPATRQKLIDHGFDIPSPDEQTPAALRAFQQAEIDRWLPIVKAANVKGD